jgi:hypothetical protein
VAPGVIDGSGVAVRGILLIARAIACDAVARRLQLVLGQFGVCRWFNGRWRVRWSGTVLGRKVYLDPTVQPMAQRSAAVTLAASKPQRTLPQGGSTMARLHCPRCRGSLYFTAEDNLPRLSCLTCGRSFVPAHEPAVSAKAA